MAAGHGAAGGPGVWAVAVIFLISVAATASFVLYKFKRWVSCSRSPQSWPRPEPG